MSETEKIILYVVGGFFALKLLGGGTSSLFGSTTASPNLLAQLNTSTTNTEISSAAGVATSFLNDFS